VVPNIELLLRSRLVKDALCSVLIGAGFSVLQEPGQDDAHTIVIIDFDDYREQKIVGGHELRGVKIVVLANEADSLQVEPDEFARLSGLLTHDLSADAFVRSLRLIGSGERVLPPDTAREQNSPAPSLGAAPLTDHTGLSPREKQTLSHVLEGHSNKLIARELGITEATVKVHLKSVQRKIRVENRTQAAIWALANLPELDTTPRGFV
jgi:two-component system, NarL family, nitrate/nitrite response regulator NarL